jgi:plasmid stabilization system protein ParE
VARVEVSIAARDDLERLILTHTLPPDTRDRVRRVLRTLETFPEIGPSLEGRWSGFRFVLGPWRWMIIVYEHLHDEDRVVVATVQDARSSASATEAR